MVIYDKSNLLTLIFTINFIYKIQFYDVWKIEEKYSLVMDRLN